MIDAKKIEELIRSSDKVLITSHKNIDLDALGSVLGLYFVVNNLGKEAHIVIDDEKCTKEVQRALDTIYKLDGIKVEKYNELKSEINKNTLLIITDTNKSNRIQNEQLLKIANKILLDHHMKNDDVIEDLMYEYVDEKESSSTEIVMDVINELNVYIPSHIATIMLAGIYVDTNGFLLKTNGNTHSCASMLHNFGADIIEEQYLLKQNYDEYKRRQELILKTEFYNNAAIIAEDDKVYESQELAKAGDVLLTFNNIEVSFVIAKLEESTVGISARSLGNINVEKIMAKFDGGGHKTFAATQIKDAKVKEVKEQLLKYLKGAIK